MYSYYTARQQELDLVGRLQAEVSNFMHLGDVRTSARGDSIIFIGRLISGAEETYRDLRDRLRPYGYTPMLRKDGDNDVVVALRGLAPGVAPAPRQDGQLAPPARPSSEAEIPPSWPGRAAQAAPRARIGSSLWLHGGLLAITTITTLLAGASFSNVNVFRALRLFVNGGNVAALLQTMVAGVPFAATLLLILGVHEMGHYVAARLHGVKVTLPYFIPAPFGLGTFGAFIAMKSPVENRKALFDVGLAGPIAGFVVAVPLMIVGLMLSSIVPAVGGGMLGRSLLVTWLINLFQPHAAGFAVQLHPIAIAAWFGLLVTAFNLMPMGQLDGGHVAYAILGKAARPLAFATFAGLLAMGYFFWSGWYTWAVFALIIGLSHPQPANDITPLDGARKFAGLLTFVLFLLLITPKPF
jgi:Zn-dependent protease